MQIQLRQEIANRLGDDARTPLSDEEALLRQTQVVLSANPNGLNPLAPVTCLYSASKNRYQCSLKPPKNVAKYPTPYYITVLEQVGGSNVVAPTGATSATDSPLIIYFKYRRAETRGRSVFRPAAHSLHRAETSGSSAG